MRAAHIQQNVRNETDQLPEETASTEKYETATAEKCRNVRSRALILEITHIPYHLIQETQVNVRYIM